MENLVRSGLREQEFLSNIYDYVSMYDIKEDSLEFLVKPEGGIFGFLNDIDSFRQTLKGEARKYIQNKFAEADSNEEGDPIWFSFEHRIEGTDLVYLTGIFIKKNENIMYSCFNILPSKSPRFDLVFGSRKHLFEMLRMNRDSVLIDYDVINNIAVVLSFENGAYKEQIIEDIYPAKARANLDTENYVRFIDAIGRAVMGDQDVHPVMLNIETPDGNTLRYTASINTVRNSRGRVRKIFVILDRNGSVSDTSILKQYSDTVSRVSNIVMETAYDMTDGKRLDYLSSRVPKAFASADTVSGLFSVFMEKITGEEVREAAMQLGQMISPDGALVQNTGAAYEFNLQMNPLADEGEPRWYKLRYVYFISNTDSHRIMCLSLVDINNEYTLMSDAINQSITDSFTGLPNRAGFLKYVENSEKHKNEARHDGLSAFMLLEPDDQRTLKSKYSLEVCDSYLRRMAESMRVCVGGEDFIAKLGDFTFLFVFHSIKSLYEFNRKVKEIKNASIVSTGGLATITTSIGGTLLRSDDRAGYRQAYEISVRALMEAQDEGGNSIKLVGINEPAKSPNIIADADVTLLPLKDVFIRTFGFFEVFVDGVPVSFKSAKAKELLAILVDRKGGLVSTREAISLMWEDEECNSVTQSRFRKVAMRLHRELEAAGIDNIVETIDHKRRINVRTVKCDLFEYLNGNTEYTKRFDGNYMLNYSWGEYTLSDL